MADTCKPMLSAMSSRNSTWVLPRKERRKEGTISCTAKQTGGTARHQADQEYCSMQKFMPGEINSSTKDGFKRACERRAVDALR